MKRSRLRQRSESPTAKIERQLDTLLRQKCLMRDGFRCIMQTTNAAPHRPPLDAAHIFGKGAYSIRVRWQLRNVVTLC